MDRNRGASRSTELERLLRETTSAIALDLVALAYLRPSLGGGGRLIALAVADGFSPGVKRFLSTCDGTEVDLLLPSVALVGGDHLARWEREYRRRKFRESLTALSLEHPELSRELLIDPRYFVHDSLLRCSYAAPQADELLRNLHGEDLAPSDGYWDVLRDLERERVIHIKDGFVAVDGGFVDAALRRSGNSNQLSEVWEQLRGLFRIGLSGVVDLLRPAPGFSIVEGVLSTVFRVPVQPKPKGFLHYPSATGLTSLTESADIARLVSRLEPSKRVDDARLERLGGVLNEVYLLSYTVDGCARRAVVKHYPNWVTLKWAPIALWTLGTQNFAILGRSRMEKECATSSLLSRAQVPVPSILYTSFEDRFLLKEYVEGENLADIVKVVIRRGSLSDDEESILRRTGG
ncbi:MAG: hypothetical protein ACE5OO_02985, partial [Candidatus Bathyarchaeia archaeon]